MYLIAGLIASLWVFKMLLFRKIILKKTPIDLFILLFVATQILSTIFSIDQHTSIFGYYGRFNGGLLSTFSYILLYYGFTSQIGTIFTRAWVIKTMKISLIVAIGVVVWGLTGWIGKDASCALFTGVWTNACWTADFKPALRMFSTLGQPNWLGAYIAVNISYCLYFLKNSFDKNKKLIHSGSLINGGILFLLYGAVFATKSRSAMLATAFVTVYFVGVQYIAKRGFPKPDVKLFTRQCTLIASIGLMAMIVFKTGVPLVDKITHPWTLFTHETLQQTQPIKQERKLFISKSSDIRRIVWKGAIALGVEHPFFGTGVETFGYSYYFTRPLEHNLTSEWDYLYNRAHNEYLNYLATSGFTGLIAYVLFIGAILYMAYKHYMKNKSLLTVALTGGFVTILITNFFGFATSTSSLFFYLTPAFLLAVFHGDAIEAVRSSDKPGHWRITYLLPVLLGVSSVLFTLSYFQADKNYNLGSSYLDQQDFAPAIKYFEQALTYKYEHVYEDKLSYALAQAALVSHVDSKAKRDSGALKLLQLAREYNAKTIRSSSKNVLYFKTASKINFLAYQITQDSSYFDASIGDLERGELLAPTEPKIPYTKALFYSSFYDQTKDTSLKQKIQKNSLMELDQAIKLKKDYRDAWFLKGSLFAKYGDVQSAISAYDYILKKIDPNDSETISERDKL